MDNSELSPVVPNPNDYGAGQIKVLEGLEAVWNATLILETKGRKCDSKREILSEPWRAERRKASVRGVAVSPAAYAARLADQRP